MPLLFLLFLPVVTVPATLLIQSFLFAPCIETGLAEWTWLECPTPLVVAARAPGLLGLASLLWLSSKSGAVRQAAAVATGLAFLRVAVPMVTLLTWGPVVGVMGPRVEGPSHLVSVLLWFVTLETLLTHYIWGRPPRSPMAEQIVMSLVVGVVIAVLTGVVVWISIGS
jgi:hypothetical protein